MTLDHVVVTRVHLPQPFFISSLSPRFQESFIVQSFGYPSSVSFRAEVDTLRIGKDVGDALEKGVPVNS